MIYLTQNNAAEILTPGIWANIASYMDDDTRESVHGDLAPCSEYAFLVEYLARDPDFSALLSSQFSIVTE